MEINRLISGSAWLIGLLLILTRYCSARSRFWERLPPTDAKRASIFYTIGVGYLVIAWCGTWFAFFPDRMHESWNIWRQDQRNYYGLVVYFITLAGSIVLAVWVWFWRGADETIRLGLFKTSSGKLLTPGQIRLLAASLLAVNVAYLLVGLLQRPESGSSTQMTSQSPPKHQSVAYRLVYDSAQADAGGINVPLVGISCAGLAAIWLIYLWARKSPARSFAIDETPNDDVPAIILPVMILVISLAVAVGSLTLSRFGVHRYSDVRMVEGTVKDFVPMPWEGHKLEHFCVSDTCFSYSDYIVTGGFNNTASHGGPIRPGERVRVFYHHDLILKLEIVP